VVAAVRVEGCGFESRAARLREHGAGGSENMFFESYGAGVGPKEAQKRGWVFMSPRSVPGAVPACLAWLREERDITPRKVFIDFTPLLARSEDELLFSRDWHKIP
jgi:hypothetical protein